jgi:hypothetical protein
MMTPASESSGGDAGTAANPLPLRKSNGLKDLSKGDPIVCYRPVTKLFAGASNGAYGMKVEVCHPLQGETP